MIEPRFASVAIWSRSITVFVAVVGVIAFCCCGGGGGTPTKYGDADDFTTEVDAKLHAEDVIKEFLKYPLDASFNWGSQATKNDAGNWIASGTVTAKNAFGAELTHEYRVSMRLVDDDGNRRWETLAVIIDEEIVYLSETAERELTDALKGDATTDPEDASTDPGVEEGEPTAPEREEGWRTFTDDTGRHTVQAKLVKFEGGKAHLEKKDGSVIALSMNRLSKEDQTWIREELKRRNAQ